MSVVCLFAVQCPLSFHCLPFDAVVLFLVFSVMSLLLLLFSSLVVVLLQLKLQLSWFEFL